MALDILFAGISYYFALLLHYEGIVPEDFHHEIMLCILIISGLLLVFGCVFHCYRNVLKYVGFGEILRQLFAVVSIFCILFFLKQAGLIKTPASVFIVNAIILFFLTAGIRVYPRFTKWLHVVLNCNRKHAKRILVVGAGSAGAMMIHRLQSTPQDCKHPVAIIDDDPDKQGKQICGIKICGTTNQIAQIALKYNAEEILIAIPSADLGTLKEIYHHCSTTGLPIMYLQNTVNIKEYLANRKKSINEVPIEALLARNNHLLDLSSTNCHIKDKVILITGAAGSIGSEICRQVLKMGCKTLVVFDINENGMFELNEELKQQYPSSRYAMVIGSVRDRMRLDSIFHEFKPQIVFHAAAHKHVPMMEINACEAIKNNVFGTKNVLGTCKKYKTPKFILISTDKAVNPTNVMGATKRLAELLVQTETDSTTEMAAVRFGNVLGSNGSVIPLFKKQIAVGGPVTVTHPDVCRYFMTIPEAVSLVLVASAIAEGGEVFVLDMGKSVRIYDLACELIRSSGFEPNQDIDIVFTGLRPGEKLFEELSLSTEKIEMTQNKKIFLLHSGPVNEIKLKSDLIILNNMIKSQNDKEIRNVLFSAIRQEWDSNDQLPKSIFM